MVFQERSSTKFQGHTGWKVDDLNPIGVRLLGRSQLSNPSDLPCFQWAKFSVNYIDLCQLQNYLALSNPQACNTSLNQLDSWLSEDQCDRIHLWCFLAATKRLWIVSQSVCLSVRLSVGPSVIPFSLCFHHRIIMKLSGVNTIDWSDVQANGQGQRSMVKVTKVKTQFSHFLTITPVWIHIWRWNDAQSLMWQRIGALLSFKVIHQISRSPGTKNHQFWLELGVSAL